MPQGATINGRLARTGWTRAGVIEHDGVRGRYSQNVRDHANAPHVGGSTQRVIVDHFRCYNRAKQKQLIPCITGTSRHAHTRHVTHR